MKKPVLFFPALWGLTASTTAVASDQDLEAGFREPTADLAYAGRCDEPMGEFWSRFKFGAASSRREGGAQGEVAPAGRTIIERKR